MKKTVRILTGFHAGAALELTHGGWRIGNSIDSDIQLTDWDGEQLLLQYHDNGRVTLEKAGDERRTRFPEVLEDWMPTRRYATILCTGPADAIWPGDADLLERMKAAKPLSGERRERLVSRICRTTLTRGIATAVMLASTGATMLPTGVAHQHAATNEPAASNKASQLAAVRARLAELQDRELSATLANGRVQVSGMVATSGDELDVRRALATVDGPAVETHLSVARTVADDLRTAAGDPGVAVRYAGRGVFEVSGQTDDPARVRAVLSSAANDYRGAIGSLHFDLHEKGAMRNIESLIDTGNLKYIEFPDGTKELVSISR
jgi:type III secretion protein D